MQGLKIAKYYNIRTFEIGIISDRKMLWKQIHEWLSMMHSYRSQLHTACKYKYIGMSEYNSTIY